MTMPNDFARKVKLHQKNTHLPYSKRRRAHDFIDVDGVRAEQGKQPLALSLARVRTRRGHVDRRHGVKSGFRFRQSMSAARDLWCKRVEHVARLGDKRGP